MQQDSQNNSPVNHQANQYIPNRPVVNTHTGLLVWTASSLKAATQELSSEWVVKTDDITLASNLLDKLAATRIVTDTRQLQAGDIFLAIVGDTFDGHAFLQQAVEKGAIAAIVRKVNPAINIPQLIVEDTRLAFGQIAAYRRRQHPSLKVIALTGSSGKTTVKEMLRSIFSQLERSIPSKAMALKATTLKATQSKAAENKSYESLAQSEAHTTLVTRGNLNNDYGVPMMLLELSDHHKYAVLELGANHVGEIAYVADIVKPDVACVLNIGTAHLGEFGGRDNIAKTKSEIYQFLDADGIAIIPADDEYSEQLLQTAKQYTSHILQFGRPQYKPISNKYEHADVNLNLNLNTSNSPELFATNIITTDTDSQFDLHFMINAGDTQPHKLGNQSQDKPNRQDSQSQVPSHKQSLVLTINLPVAGQHNIDNALAAAACAYAIGIEPHIIVSGLQQTRAGKGRLSRQRLGLHHVIDDTYNANPNSVRAAADVLSAQAGSKILVLGDIGELGTAATDEHYRLGQAIGTKQIDFLLCVGEFAPHTVAGAIDSGHSNAHAFASKTELLQRLEGILIDKDSVKHSCSLLFKGSRTMTMETLITDLESKYS